MWTRALLLMYLQGLVQGVGLIQEGQRFLLVMIFLTLSEQVLQAMVWRLRVFIAVARSTCIGTGANGVGSRGAGMKAVGFAGA
jgi:hypothetical protein